MVTQGRACLAAGQPNLIPPTAPLFALWLHIPLLPPPPPPPPPPLFALWLHIPLLPPPPPTPHPHPPTTHPPTPTHTTHPPTHPPLTSTSTLAPGCNPMIKALGRKGARLQGGKGQGQGQGKTVTVKGCRPKGGVQATHGQAQDDVRQPATPLPPPGHPCACTHLRSRPTAAVVSCAWSAATSPPRDSTWGHRAKEGRVCVGQLEGDTFQPSPRGSRSGHDQPSRVNAKEQRAHLPVDLHSHAGDVGEAQRRGEAHPGAGVADVEGQQHVCRRAGGDGEVPGRSNARVCAMQGRARGRRSCQQTRRGVGQGKTRTKQL